MNTQDIRLLPDACLREVCEPIARVDAKIQHLADNMLNVMYDAEGIGLAASQVGILQRMFVVDVAEAEDELEPQKNPMVFINPKIVWSSEELNVHNEGCLSIPEIYEKVERPKKVRIEFLNREGAECELEADGLLATCIQHEYDHLNGVLFIDHLSRLKRERAVKKFNKAAKQRA